MGRTIEILPLAAGAEASSNPLQAPRLEGEPQRLRRALAALDPVVQRQLGWGVPRGAWLRSLRVTADEVELALDPALRGCGPSLAEAAFEALKRALPDTDIYVGAAG